MSSSTPDKAADSTPVKEEKEKNRPTPLRNPSMLTMGKGSLLVFLEKGVKQQAPHTWVHFADAHGGDLHGSADDPVTTIGAAAENTIPLLNQGLSAKELEMTIDQKTGDVHVSQLPDASGDMKVMPIQLAPLGEKDIETDTWMIAEAGAKIRLADVPIEIRLDPKGKAHMTVNEQDITFEPNLPYMVGRNKNEENRHIVISSSNQISREHATIIVMSDGRVLVRNNSTSNPTTIITEAQAPVEKEQTFVVAAESRKRSESGENEDSTLILDNAIGVFDGVGGRSLGEEASKITAKHTEEILRGLPKTASPADIENAIRLAFGVASSEIVQRFPKQEPIISRSGTVIPGLGSPATTAAVAYIGQGNFATVGWIGDSQVYRIRGNELTQLTRDHGAPEEMIEDALRQQEMTLYEANWIRHQLGETDDPEIINRLSDYHLRDATTGQPKLSESGRPIVLDFWNTRATITRAVGHEGDEPEFLTVQLQKGDRLFAATDGVGDVLKRSKIQELATSEKTPSEHVAELLDEVDRVNGSASLRRKPDDKTVVELLVS